MSTNDNGPKDAVAAMIKRLAHRNANVQLYTLELANALSQNCGPAMHRELASRSFTDAMLRLAGERVSTRSVEDGRGADKVIDNTSTSQVEDRREDGRVDQDVRKK